MGICVGDVAFMHLATVNFVTVHSNLQFLEEIVARGALLVL